MEKILSDLFSSKIISPDKCETCKCFEILSEDHILYKLFHHKYHCLVKKGDDCCDYIKNQIKFFNDIERIENIEDMEERKKYRMEYMKKKL